jgi:hypothetical protein
MKFITGQKFSSLAGIFLVLSFLPLLFISNLRGKHLPIFLLCFSLAGMAYLLTSLRLNHFQIPLKIIWIIAILARLILLGTSPSLSDDVYRYLWDGHLMDQGINSYAEPVNSHLLDPFATPLREKVNHPQMASPYLPVAQVYFWIIEQIAPQLVKAYQLGAMLLDLLIGLMVQRLLVRLRLNPASVLIYLWNPLVIVEFTHAAHVDVLMLFLIMISINAVLSDKKKQPLSAILLALATLTKGLPVFFSLLWLRKWRTRYFALFIFIVGIATAGFALGAGWGLFQVMDGRGIFGAARIYANYWRFNSSPIFNLVDTTLSMNSRYASSITRLLSGAVLLAIAAWSGKQSWKLNQPGNQSIASDRSLVRISLLPLGTYLLLSPTVHPWYLTWLIPFLPFFIPGEDDSPKLWHWLVPIIYFSLVVSLSYLAYVSQTVVKVPTWVLWMEYLPLYVGLIWAAVSFRQ